MHEALSALVIHDIKNSLALLELELEQLSHQPGLPVEVRKAHHRCVELKNRLIGFLTLYKVGQGGLRPVMQAVSVLEFLEELIDTSQSVQMAGMRHGRAITVTVAESRVAIDPAVRHAGMASFDAHLLDLALESALGNAMRYARTQVEVWFEQTPEFLTFFVLDDGPGIAVEQGVAQRGRAENFAATGLGLALCQAVADAHGRGAVALSNILGGTQFSMTLRFDEQG